MLFSATGISITMLTLLVASPQNTVSQSIHFSLGNMYFFPFMFVVFSFASITEFPFVSFSAFFVDRYVVL
jgi:hypothetical protein